MTPRPAGLSLRPIFVATLVILPGLTLATPFFPRVGSLPGGEGSFINGISADGMVAVGRAVSSSGPRAVRWTAAGGLTELPLPAGADFADATGVSADGSVIVGFGSFAAGGGASFRWVNGAPPELLTPLALPRAVSGNGEIVVGDIATPDGIVAFRWSDGEGMTILGDLAGGAIDSRAFSVSGDGETVVGVGTSFSPSNSSQNEAFRWTSSTGMEGIGDLPGGGFGSIAHDVSADGTTIVGISDSAASLHEAFRWTEAEGMVPLGHLPGGLFASLANGVSGDGAVIVGTDHAPFGEAAFIWDPTSGMRLLQEVLEVDFGLDLTGWTLTEALDISADGRTVVGVGTNPLGVREGWVAHLAACRT